MTRQARLVLDDCHGALSDLIDGIQGAQWRRRWITCVVLLRVVGHVLDKIDGNASGVLRDEIRASYDRLKQTRPEPKIFWEFIELERNNILKEYKVNAGQGIRIIGGKTVYNETGNIVDSTSGSIDYLYHIRSGPFVGRSQHDVICEAIDWWQRYLDEIDRAVIGACV